MEIVYGESKRQANLAKHGFDFADFEDAFSLDRILASPARPSATGRQRLRLIGTWNEEIVVVVIVSPLGSEAISLVSIRPANAKERNAYDNR